MEVHRVNFNICINNRFINVSLRSKYTTNCKFIAFWCGSKKHLNNSLVCLHTIYAVKNSLSNWEGELVKQKMVVLNKTDFCIFKTLKQHRRIIQQLSRECLSGSWQQSMNDENSYAFSSVKFRMWRLKRHGPIIKMFSGGNIFIIDAVINPCSDRCFAPERSALADFCRIKNQLKLWFLNLWSPKKNRIYQERCLIKRTPGVGRV